MTGDCTCRDRSAAACASATIRSRSTAHLPTCCATAPRRADDQPGRGWCPPMIRAYQRLHRRRGRALGRGVDRRRARRRPVRRRRSAGCSSASRCSRGGPTGRRSRSRTWPRSFARWRFPMIDCQMRTAHLASLGAEDMPRRQFVTRSTGWCASRGRPGAWTLDEDLSESFAVIFSSERVEARMRAQRIHRRIGLQERASCPAAPVVRLFELLHRAHRDRRASARCTAIVYGLTQRPVTASPAAAAASARSPARASHSRPAVAGGHDDVGIVRRSRRLRRAQRLVVEAALQVGAFETGLRFERVGLNREGVLTRTRRLGRLPQMQVEPADVGVGARRQRIEIARRRDVRDRFVEAAEADERPRVVVMRGARGSG